MNKYIIKKVLALAIFIACTTMSYAGPVPIVDSNYVHSVSVDEYYARFMNSIIAKENIIEDDKHNPGRLYLYEGNNNLIIGCSPVSYAYMYAKPLVANYKYDLVGFGATTDDKLLSWLQILDKKYNKIVIWGQVNDIFAILNKENALGSTFYTTLDSIFAEAKNHLKGGPDSKIAFINVKPMTAEDGLNEFETNIFNIEALKINQYVKSLNIPSINIKSSTDSTNSEWYLHFTNPAVFNEIFRDIESLGEKS